MELTGWWSDDGGFFGRHYVAGDNSIDGYLPSRKLTLDQRTKREVDGIINILELKDGASVLDVPCGYGRHSIALATRGYKVTGVDINQHHLSLARLQTKQAGKKPTFIRADMRRLSASLESKNDAVINMFFSFGFFEREDENEEVMGQFNQCLNPGGRLLLHTDVTVEMITEGKLYRLEEERKLAEGKALNIRESWDPVSMRLNGSWSIYNNKEEIHLTPYSVRIYSAQEYASMAQRRGFRNIAIYGSFDGSDYDVKSEEMILVASK
jgi:SAM-dependent methyltransferase